MSLFTQILQGQLPGHFVWRDAQCFAIMTLGPIREGHCMVIPNEEIDHWDDVPAPLAAHLFQVSQKIAKGIKQAFPCKRVGVEIVGLEVPHTHIHLIPIDAMHDMEFARARQASPEQLAAAAARLRQALVALGHEAAREQ